MADSKPGLRKPVFTKVEQLRPGTSGHTLTVKVVNVKMVMQKGRSDGPQSRQMRIAECLVGDETGMIIFTARNDQDFVNPMLREDADARSPSSSALKFEKYLNPALDFILWLRPEKCRSKRETDTSGSQFLKNSYNTTQTYRLLSESRIERKESCSYVMTSQI
ncbi:hypothetical protein V8G54_016160 [Vigna mungo]|uniref:Single-stranded DNA binding protein Ssb-like OB fold domain-containing protein n=1 Tax=Vigna mungo TaxID=3915 RepID=A0AAQ3NKN2_VIGMU